MLEKCLREFCETDRLFASERRSIGGNYGSKGGAIVIRVVIALVGSVLVLRILGNTSERKLVLDFPSYVGFILDRLAAIR
jgi:hypothetical protein